MPSFSTTESTLAKSVGAAAMFGNSRNQILGDRLDKGRRASGCLD